MIQPCANTTPCNAPCDSPLANLSTESEDFMEFISVEYTDNTNIPFVPTIGTNWSQVGCLGICESTISQQDADLCAKNQQALCQHHGDFPPLPCNDQQTATILCPDGSPFSFTAPACIIFARTVADANIAAFQYALRSARAEIVCFKGIVECACVGQNYFSTIPVTSATPVDITVYSGSLPPGLFLDGHTITGVPLSNGTYSFTLQAFSRTGSFMRKQFQIAVLEITSTSLPAFTIGIPYSYQLQATGGSGNYAWRISSGSLPPGLVMSQSGLITGVPV